MSTQQRIWRTVDSDTDRQLRREAQEAAPYLTSRAERFKALANMSDASAETKVKGVKLSEMLGEAARWLSEA